MMKKRNLKDLTKTVNSDVISSLLNKASEDNLIRLVAYIPGVLSDNFLFENYDYLNKQGITITNCNRNHKVRHYIIIKEKYLNEWISDTVAIETDSQKQYDKFIQDAENTEDGTIY